MIDYVHSVLGEYVSSHAHTQIQHAKQSIINQETGEKRPFTSDVPDLVSVHGKLKPSPYVEEGASLVSGALMLLLVTTLLVPQSGTHLRRRQFCNATASVVDSNKRERHACISL